MEDVGAGLKRPNGSSAYGVELAVSAIGKPASGQVLARYQTTDPLTLVQAKCVGSARVAATAAAVVTVKKNGTSIGTFTFAAGGSAAAVSLSATAVAAGDVLTWEAPSSADATLEDLALTLAGTR